MKRRLRGAGVTISLCWILLLLAALFFGPGMVGTPPRSLNGTAEDAAGERVLDAPGPKPSSSPFP